MILQRNPSIFAVFSQALPLPRSCCWRSGSGACLCCSLFCWYAPLACGNSTPCSGVPAAYPAASALSCLAGAWQRLLVVAAGPAANIILAWLLCWTLALGWGTPVLLPQVGGVVQNGPADKAGIQPGDTIVSINGAAVANWQAMVSPAAPGPPKMQPVQAGNGRPSRPGQCAA